MSIVTKRSPISATAEHLFLEIKHWLQATAVSAPSRSTGYLPLSVAH